MIWEGVRSFTQRAIGSPIHIMWRWFGGTTHFRRRGGFKKIMMVPFEIILSTQSNVLLVTTTHRTRTINVELVIRAVPMMAAAVVLHAIANSYIKSQKLS